MTEHRTATAVLREEHRLILRVLAAFETLLDQGAPEPAALADFEDCMVFFRLFTDACHHGKEEDLLFAAMEEQDLPGADGPIAMLRTEHVQGRELVRAMSDTLQRVQAGHADEWRAVERQGRDYIEFLRDHIRKEDEGVFVLADELVRGPACTSLCAAYDTVCSRRFEGRTLAELAALADRISRASR